MSRVSISAAEIQDGLDNDCDGVVDNTTTAVDIDGDGYDDTEDCDDNDPFTHPGAAFMESSTDCMTDADEDGYGSDSPTARGVLEPIVMIWSPLPIQPK